MICNCNSTNYGYKLVPICYDCGDVKSLKSKTMKEKIKELKEGGRYLLSRIGRMSGKYEITVLEESKTHWKIKYENDNTEWIDKKSRIDIIEILTTPSEPSDEELQKYCESNLYNPDGTMRCDVQAFYEGMKCFRDNYQQTQQNEIKQIKIKDEQPDQSGWYDTDKGRLFWMNDESEWSCRDDRLSSEYPDIWYSPQSTQQPQKVDWDELKPKVNLVCINPECNKSIRANNFSGYCNDCWKELNTVQPLQHKEDEIMQLSWIDIKKKKPNCWETGDWDGKRSDIMLCKDKDNNKHLAQCYEGQMDGSYFFEWYDKDDFGLKVKITHWIELD